ncbi:MAG: hypothetical protein JZU52_12690 [Lamprocystis purpurea]|jgi:hypothetical protein|nr:hypothetical protein [Lamprocystis purpurea]
MALYATVEDCRDPLVSVGEADLLAADRAVEALLRNLGIDPAAVVDAAGRALLQDLAVAEATATAATGAAVESDSPLWAKAAAYRAQAKVLAARCNREALGVAALGSGAAGYASITLGRG